MSVQNGQLANQTTFNNAFPSRQNDSNTVGKWDLENTETLSGGAIFNIQKNINALCSALGITPNQAYNLLITWSSTVVGLANSSAKDKIEALVTKFVGATGHTHTGTDGDGAVISALDLSNINKFEAHWQSITALATSGLTFDATALLTGKVSGGNSTTVGVITDVPSNRVLLVDRSNGTFVTDPEGQTVYGRIDSSFLITFYTLESGVETAYNLPSTDLDIYFLEVFTISSRPTIPSMPAIFGQMDITNDVAEATQLVAGKVNIGTQEFAGWKQFFGDVSLLSKVLLDSENDSTTTGADAAMPAPLKSIYILTNASLTSILSIAAGGANQFVVLINETGAEIEIKSTNIFTGGGSRYLPNNSSTILVYNSGWFLVGTVPLITNNIGSSPNAKGLTHTGNKLNLEPASSGFGGVVNTDTQQFAGQKEFVDGLKIPNGKSVLNQGVQIWEIITNNTLTGANQQVPDSGSTSIRLTLNTLTSIDGIAGSLVSGAMKLVMNDTGNTLSLNHMTGTPTNQRLYISGGATIGLPTGYNALFIYESTLQAWKLIGKWDASSGGAGTPTNTFDFNANGIFAVANGVDGVRHFPFDAKITNVLIWKEVQGSSGSTTFRLQYKAPDATTWTNITNTNGVINAAAGANVDISTGQTKANMTALVLTSTPYLVLQRGAVKMDLTTVDAGTPNTCGMVIFYEPQ